MAKVRMGRDEMNLIIDVASRMAKRMHTRFVVDNEKVEIVDSDRATGRSDRSAAEQEVIQS